MDLPIELRFKLTEEEFIRATRKAIMGHPFTWILSIASILCLGLATAATSNGGPALAVPLLLAGGGGLYVFYLVLIAPSRAYAVLNPAFRENPISYRFTSTGVEVKAETFQSRWDWSIFRHYSDAELCFIIYPRSQGTCLLIPKRAFNSTETLEGFRRLLATKLRIW